MEIILYWMRCSSQWSEWRTGEIGSEEEIEKRLWPVHFVWVADVGVEMREESNRVSCSSRDGNGQERWRWWLLFCGPGTYGYDGGHVCGSDRNERAWRFVGWRRERSQRQSLDSVQMNKEELAEQAEGKVKESELWITAEVGRWAWTQSWMDWGEKIGCHPGGNSGARGLKLINDNKWEVYRNKRSEKLGVIGVEMMWKRGICY